MKSLTDLVKDNIQNLYPEQFKEVLTILDQAFDKNENNSLMLLSRSKQTVHAFLNQIEKQIHKQNIDRKNNK